MVKLVSLNIERSKHLHLVLPFLLVQRPDVVALQEVCDRDIKTLEEALQMQSVFAPMSYHPAEGSAAIMGVGIFSRLPIRLRHMEYYVGDSAQIPITPPQQIMINNVLLMCDVTEEGKQFTIATTHFPWTSDGSASDVQRKALVNMFAMLDAQGEFVLCGDFNAPRGGEIFSALTAKYKDNIPPEYITSLDLSLHRDGKTKPHELDHKMVDGLFSTPGYRVSEVKMVSGVSDHCALVGKVEKI